MLPHIEAWALGVMHMAEQTYGVNPILFLALLTGCSPFFYFSIYRIARAASQRRHHELAVWSVVFLISTALPYLYVMVFGKNLPPWVYGILILLIGQGIYSLIRRIRKGRRKN